MVSVVSVVWASGCIAIFIDQLVQTTNTVGQHYHCTQALKSAVEKYNTQLYHNIIEGRFDKKLILVVWHV